MKANNYLVTYSDLSTMGLPTKGVPATGNRIATKQFIVDNYYVTNSSPFSTYTSNRCPPYQSIIAATPLSYSYTLYFDYNDGPENVVGFNTGAIACSDSINSMTVYSNSSTISVGMAIYYDLYGTQPMNAVAYTSPNQTFFKMNGNYVTFEPSAPEMGAGNVVHSVDTCAPTGYIIDWSFSQGAQSGDFSILVDGVQVVYTTVTNSGQITVPSGSYVGTSVGAGAQSLLTAEACLTVTDGITTLYNNCSQGYPSAGESYSFYYPSDNGTITATSYEF